MSDGSLRMMPNSLFKVKTIIINQNVRKQNVRKGKQETQLFLIVHCPFPWFADTVELFRLREGN